MPTDTFEYVDEDGKTHQAHSLRDVPQKYLKSMLVIGGEDRQQQQAAQVSVPPRVDPRLQKILIQAQSVNANITLSVILLTVWLLVKNYLVRIAVACIAVIWGFHVFYTWFENSTYSQPGERIRPKVHASADR